MHDCRLLRGVIRSSRPANIPTLFTNAAVAWAAVRGAESHLPPRLHAQQQPAAPGSMAQEQLEDNAPRTTSSPIMTRP